MFLFKKSMFIYYIGFIWILANWGKLLLFLVVILFWFCQFCFIDFQIYFLAFLLWLIGKREIFLFILIWNFKFKLLFDFFISFFNQFFKVCHWKIIDLRVIFISVNNFGFLYLIFILSFLYLPIDIVRLSVSHVPLKLRIIC